MKQYVIKKSPSSYDQILNLNLSTNTIQIRYNGPSVRNYLGNISTLKDIYEGKC